MSLHERTHPMERQPIHWDDSLREALLKMSEDNPSVLRILYRLLEEYGQEGLPLLLMLDDMNMRGAQIFVGYKHHCHGDLERFVQSIRTRDLDMIDAVNREGRKGRYPHKAEAHAGKSRRRGFLHDGA